MIVAHKPRHFDLAGLNGISDRTLEMHFKLYEGYVAQVNRLNEETTSLLRGGHLAPKDIPAWSEMKRRFGFEYNGMVLHELYFENLSKRTGQAAGEAFHAAAEASFGSFESWKVDFTATGVMRGVGWAICSRDASSGRLGNHWISSHEEGNVAGFTPILVMDVWEHAFLLDYKPADRPKYIEAFFSNVDWASIEGRLAT